MDNGLKDFIEELREYGNARKGELAGMLLEAANRLEELAGERDRMADFIAAVSESIDNIVRMDQ